MSYRPRICEICYTPLVQAKTGRARKTCSDRCRQIKRRRYDYHKWRDPRANDQAYRAAERTLRAIEREAGPIDDTVPEYKDIHSSTLSVRRRLIIRLAMGQELPTCRQCFKPYIREEGTAGFCSQACKRAHQKHEEAIRNGMREHYGKIDPRVSYRLVRDLPVSVCLQCGKPFPHYYARQKFCSAACRKQQWEAKNRKITKRCAQCGERFPASANLRKIYCSRRCKTRAGDKRDKARHAVPEHVVCAVCGAGFFNYRQQKGKRKYCSKLCYRRAAASRKRESRRVP